MELVISDIKIRLIYCNTYNIARQSVVDKMVREISLEVREKSGKSQGILLSHFCGNPGSGHDYMIQYPVASVANCWALVMTSALTIT